MFTKQNKEGISNENTSCFDRPYLLVFEGLLDDAYRASVKFQNLRVMKAQIERAFNAEQITMSGLRYPNMNQHKKNHRDLISTLNNIINQGANLDTCISAQCMKDFINQAVHHADTHDKLFKRFISEHCLNEKGNVSVPWHSRLLGGMINTRPFISEITSVRSKAE